MFSLFSKGLKWLFKGNLFTVLVKWVVLTLLIEIGLWKIGSAYVDPAANVLFQLATKPLIVIACLVKGLSIMWKGVTEPPKAPKKKKK